MGEDLWRGLPKTREETFLPPKRQGSPDPRRGSRGESLLRGEEIPIVHIGGGVYDDVEAVFVQEAVGLIGAEGDTFISEASSRTK